MYEFNDKCGFYLKSDRILSLQPTLSVAAPTFGLKGEFRALLWNPNGTLAYDSGWNSNLITDYGLDTIDQSFPNWCSIGSSATAPTTGDTSIGTFLAAKSSHTNPMPNTDYPRPPVAPNWERYSIRKTRFEAGEGTGTINEFTYGWVNDGTNIFCRHVLPASIPKAANQSLDIYYRYTVYPDLTPNTGTVTIDGTLYDWECSRYDYDTYNYYVLANMDFNTTFNSNFLVFDGAKGTSTTAPTGSSANSASSFVLTSGSGFRTRRYTAGLDWCNTASNTITVIATPLEQYFRVQIEVLDNATRTTGFTKDNTMEMVVDWKLTWARYP